MVYEVIVDIASSEVDKVFDYSYAEDIPLGMRVLVPFGPRTLEGFVIGKKESSHRETKNIIKQLDASPIIKEELICLAKYLKEHKNLRFIDTIRLCIPPKLRGGRVKELKKGYIRLADTSEVSLLPKSAKKQLQVIEHLKNCEGEYESVLNSEFGASSVKALMQKGIVAREYIEQYRKPKGREISDKERVVLLPEQQSAVDEILAQNREFLIHGVTGSGKTEIYMTVIEEQLKLGKSAIMLVPEISLTPQMLGLFRNRFGDNVSLLHSALGDGERYDEWRRLLSGEASVALGARSAIFAPLDNIGVIIIDEEHDNSYVSESNPRYFTHDIASYRRQYNDAKLILGSATPSMESYKRAIENTYGLITLKNRVNAKQLPDMMLVDMRKEIRMGNAGLFSRAMLAALEDTIGSGNQVMLFVNRRGFASFLRCKECGYIPKCTDCEVSLTYHKDDDRLKCHYCGKQYYVITECPECGNTHMREGKIGTERVVEEVERLFPGVKTLRMDVDTTKGKNSYLDILSAFANGEAQVLVGTQMIAKGHDFKDVTLVGILDADLSLYFSDYRSNENTFQLITQVAGRAGRKDKAGRVVMQTYNPNHYVFRFAREYDYCGFFEKECNIREATQFPPYSVIARILVQGENEEKAYAAARDGYAKIKELQSSYPSVFKVQAMRAPIKRIMKKFRFQIVAWVKEGDESPMNALYEIAGGLKSRDVNSFVEINPTQMM